jgi:hypothetical protein
MNLSRDLLERKLQVQMAHQWDIEKDIFWDTGIDLEKPLLPSLKSTSIIPDSTKEEELVFSQIMGLIAAAAIAEHEKLLNDLKKECFHQTLRRYKVNDNFRKLGELFFEDEAKHSAAFNRYIDMYAEMLNISSEELRTILPTHNKSSLFSFILKLNSYFGGMAFWWSVAATEEHSMEIFKMIRPLQEKIDPLYYQIHKLHFEEEVRHSSFALMMLNLNRSENASFFQKILKKLDFLLSDIIEKCWTIVQLKKLSKLNKLTGRHPILDTFATVMQKINKLPFHKRINILLNEADYLSLMVNSRKHLTIKKEIEKSKAVAFNLLPRIP